MRTILTEVLKDALGEVTIDGCGPTAISSDAEVLGSVFLATEDYENDRGVGTPFRDHKIGDEVLESHPVSKKAGLRVRDAGRGDIIINETKASFADKVNACCVPAE